jgi:hypothetical protein
LAQELVRSFVLSMMMMMRMCFRTLFVTYSFLL